MSAVYPYMISKQRGISPHEWGYPWETKEKTIEE